MAQHGRKSAEALMVLSSEVDVVERQPAPETLTREEAEIWCTVVSSEPADWFGISCAPLLEQYCRHTVQAKKVASMINSGDDLTVEEHNLLLQMQERETRALALLATKMRITNQSTTTKRGNKRATMTRKPWE